MLPSLLSSDIVTPELYKSDHNMVVTILYKKDLFNDIPMASARSSVTTKRKIFNYKKMTKEKWEEYGTNTDFLCRRNTKLNRLNEHSFKSASDLNFYWTEIRNII